MSSVRAERAQSGGVGLRVERTGAGTPVLLISGLGYSSWCWWEVRERLAPDYTVITFDNRGTGRSDHPAGPYSIAMLADDAARVLEHCGIGPAQVIAHSMGGYIAQMLALRHPSLVKSLVLIGTSPGGPESEPLPEATQAAWSAAARLSPEDNVRATMPLAFSRGWTESHPRRFREILRRRVEFPTTPECWLAQYEACVGFFGDGAEVEKIAVPTLLIHGDDDRIVPVANGRMLARRLPHSRYVELPAGGHLPYLEDVDGFVRLVGPHLLANTIKA